MGHGTVADEIKGRQAQFVGERSGAILKIEEEGVTFRSYLDGSTHFMGPETSMEVQAALRSDIALVFDECTPFHGGREYTARSTERTHRWLDRCIDWHRQHGPEGQTVYGIVQGGVEEDLRRASAQEVAARDYLGGIAIGGTLGETKDQMFTVVEWTIEELPEDKPRHLLGIGEVDDLVRGVELGIDTFDCAMPTRIGRHGMAVVPDPAKRWRVDLAKARWKQSEEPICEGCPCPSCEPGYSRAYIHYLFKAQEQTAMRLLTIHNLAYLQRLMAELRAAIDEDRLAAARGAPSRDGAAPWETGVTLRGRSRRSRRPAGRPARRRTTRYGPRDRVRHPGAARRTSNAGDRVLDVGCGPGTLSAAAAERGAHVTGVDLAAGHGGRGAPAPPRPDVHRGRRRAPALRRRRVRRRARRVPRQPHAGRARRGRGAQARRAPGRRSPPGGRRTRSAFLTLPAQAVHGLGGVPDGPDSELYAHPDRLAALLGDGHASRPCATPSTSTRSTPSGTASAAARSAPPLGSSTPPTSTARAAHHARRAVPRRHRLRAAGDDPHRRT